MLLLPTFLNYSSPHEVNVQYGPFSFWNVPVWYPWGGGRGWRRSCNYVHQTPISCFQWIYESEKSVNSLSHIWLFATPWTVAHQTPLSMGFPRQESWSGLPYPSPGDLPNPGIEPGSLALQADSLPSEPLGKPLMYTFIQQPMNSSYSTGLKPNLFSPPTLLPTSVIGTTLPCARMRAHTHTHCMHACAHTHPQWEMPAQWPWRPPPQSCSRQH